MQDGISGYIVPDLDAAVDAVKRVPQLDRKKIRKQFEQRFTAAHMTQDYLKIYERMVTRKRAPFSVANGVLNWMKLTSPNTTT